VQVRGRGRPARQHEGLQRRQRGVHLVAALLQPGDLLRQHAQPLAVVAGGDREVGADIEQVVLDAAQPGVVGLRQAADGQRDAELGVQLVGGAVRLDARMRLAHAAHVAQVGLAVVAELGVDAGEIDGHPANDRGRGGASVG